MQKTQPNILSKIVQLSIGFFVLASQPTLKQVADQCQQVDEIIKDVGLISFPDKQLNILDYGAITDGVKLNTPAINQAIKNYTDAGGGKVIIPTGKFLTSAILLENNVNLHLEEGAGLLYITDPSSYPVAPTFFETIIKEQSNSSNWRTWKGSEKYGWKDVPDLHDSLNRIRLVNMAEDQVPVNQRIFGNGHFLCPNFFEPFESENVLI